MRISTLLKEKTSTLHREVESHSILNELLDPNIDCANYYSIINQCYVGYTQWQASLDSAYSQLTLAEKMSCVKDHMRFLPINLHTQQMARDLAQVRCEIICNRQPLLIQMESLEHYLGFAYVFEGSRMGARYILRALKTAPKLHSVSTFHYFEHLSSSPINGLGWQQWKKQLDNVCFQLDLNSDLVFDGATRCFLLIKDWFQEHNVNCIPARHSLESH
jgi:heme oxygenase